MGKSVEEEEKLNVNPESSVAKNKYKDPHTFLCSVRWRTVGYIFLGYILLYMHRVNLSLAIVCMVDTTAPLVPGHHSNASLNTEQGEILANYTSPNISTMGGQYTSVNISNKVNSNPDSCGIVETADAANRVRFAELHWQKSEISILLSSYFYGSFFTQIPSGTMADIFGGKHIITAAMMVSMVCSLVTPVCARTSIILMYVVRITLGLAGGSVIPAGMSILNSWAPPNERPVMIAFLAAGFLTGTIITFLTSGLLCVYGFDNGWPSIFYIHGTVTLLFIIVWVLEAYSIPRNHPRLSKQELQFIQSSKGLTEHTKRPKTPWKRILLSRPLWASFVTHFCYNWSFFTVLINVPLFLKEVLKFDVKSNGLYSSVPYVFQIISSIGCGKMSVVMIKKKCLGHLATRRFFNTICMVGMAACLAGAGYISCEFRYVAVILLCLSCAFAGFAYGGIFANHPEYAGQFAGTAFGITNAGGVISSILASMLAGQLTPNGLQEEWQRVFFIAAAVDIFGAVIFALFADVYLQPWAAVPQSLTIEVGATQELKEIQLLNQREN